MTLLVLVFFGLLFAGIPISFALLAAGLGYLMTAPRLNMMVGPQQLIDSIDSFPLLAVPFFLLAGTLMNEAGVTQHLITLARSLIGHIRGGLAHTVVLAGALMAGGSGSGTADSAALGTVMIPQMKKEGFSAPFAVVLTACAGSLAPIIPPSIMFILYGHLGNVSVGELFMAGIVPGVMFAACLIVISYVVSVRNRYGTVSKRASPGDMARALGVSLLDLMLPVIIMGGIVGGVFTPTEAGAVAVLYVLFLGVVVYRVLTLQKILNSLRDSIVILGAVMLIISAAGLAQFILALMQAGDLLAASFVSLTENPYVFLLLASLLLLVLGMVLEVTAVLVLMTPILVPALVQYGIDPVHFGVVMIICLTIGLLTPPVGLSMFVTCAIGRVRVEDYSRAVVPFLLVLLGLLVLLVLVPQIVLWLPHLVR
ncbi:MAG: TRAP transporter large permease [bacterium]